MVVPTSNDKSRPRPVGYIQAAAGACHAPASGVFRASERYHDYLMVQRRPAHAPVAAGLQKPMTVSEMYFAHALKGHDLAYGLTCGALASAAALPCMVAGSVGLGVHFIASRLGACIDERRGEACGSLAAQATLVALHAVGGALELMLASMAALSGAVGSGVGGVVGLALFLSPRMRAQQARPALALAPRPALPMAPVGGETAASLPLAFFPGIRWATLASSRQLGLESLFLARRLQSLCQDIDKAAMLVVEVTSLWARDADTDETLCGLEKMYTALPQKYTRLKQDLGRLQAQARMLGIQNASKKAAARLEMLRATTVQHFAALLQERINPWHDATLMTNTLDVLARRQALNPGDAPSNQEMQHTIFATCMLMRLKHKNALAIISGLVEAMDLQSSEHALLLAQQNDIAGCEDKIGKVYVQPAIAQILGYEALVTRQELEDILSGINHAPADQLPDALQRTTFLWEYYQTHYLDLLPEIGPELQALFSRLDAHFQAARP